MKLFNKIIKKYKSDGTKEITHLETSTDNVYSKKYKLYLDTLIEGIFNMIHLTRKTIEPKTISFPGGVLNPTFMKITKVDSLVSIYGIGYLQQALTTGENTLGTLDAKYCPLVTVEQFYYDNATPTWYRLKITKDGAVSVYVYHADGIAKGYGLQFNVTYSTR